MAKFRGRVGFSVIEDDQITGIASETYVEKTYYGRVIDHTRRWESTDHLNDDLAVSNQIAIVANDYAFKHMSAIRYVYFMNAPWSVSSMKVKHPEIILTLGGAWHG